MIFVLFDIPYVKYVRIFVLFDILYVKYVSDEFVK